jgi:hypothetical protein
MAERECEHLSQAVEGVTPSGEGCKECLEKGMRWVHLRMCTVCGHVGCCDSSPGKHATRHYWDTDHAVMQSYEPGDTWGWCYVDEQYLGPFEPVRG